MTIIVSDRLFEILRPERLTAVVDIGANVIEAKGESPPPYKRMMDNGLCTVTGFEPQTEGLETLNRLKGPQERYFPYAVGDGGEKTLRICYAPGMTSLLEPDEDHLALFNDFPILGQVEREIRMPTRRLDDIDEIEAVDFLKMDVQGSELDILKSGQRKLARAVAIQTEVSFVTLYRKQPTLGAIDTFLREMGFVPHCFAEIKRWPIAPAVFDGNRRSARRQLLEADMVYVRDFSRTENMDGEQWKHLAMIAHHCYGSFDLALRAVMVAAQSGAIDAGAFERYLQYLRAPVAREERA